MWQDIINADYAAAVARAEEACIDAGGKGVKHLVIRITKEKDGSIMGNIKAECKL